MDPMVILWIGLTAVAFVLVISLFEYRKRLKELELSVRFDELERMVHIRTDAIERQIEESDRAMWAQFERVESRFDDCARAEECCMQAAPPRRQR